MRVVPIPQTCFMFAVSELPHSIGRNIPALTQVSVTYSQPTLSPRPNTEFSPANPPKYSTALHALCTNTGFVGDKVGVGAFEFKIVDGGSGHQAVSANCTNRAPGYWAKTSPIDILSAEI